MDGRDFRGSGWRFPIRPQAGGALGYVDGDDNVAQSLFILLNTAAGERVMRPEFGTAAPDLIFEADSEQNLFRLEQTLLEAARRWEPRVEVESVRATRGDDEQVAAVSVAVTYRVLRTNTRRNLVFPYYLAGGGPVEL